MVCSSLKAPQNLAAQRFGSDIVVSWVDNTADHNGFKLERKDSRFGPYVEIVILGAGVRSYSDNSLDPARVYTYRIRAFNSGGNSPYSNEAAA
jgi:titin